MDGYIDKPKTSGCIKGAKILAILSLILQTWGYIGLSLIFLIESHTNGADDIFFIVCQYATVPLLVLAVFLLKHEKLSNILLCTVFFCYVITYTIFIISFLSSGSSGEYGPAALLLISSLFFILAAVGVFTKLPKALMVVSVIIGFIPCLIFVIWFLFLTGVHMGFACFFYWHFYYLLSIITTFVALLLFVIKRSPSDRMKKEPPITQNGG